MKKNKISSKIIKFFDKAIIIPITKIVDKISKKWITLVNG